VAVSQIWFDFIFDKTLFDMQVTGWTFRPALHLVAAHVVQFTAANGAISMLRKAARPCHAVGC
jgi:hypothetical protein